MLKALLAATVTLLLFHGSSQSAHAQAAPPAEVRVNNFPETQQIKGDVNVGNFPDLQQVKGTVSIDGATKFIKREGVIVPTSRRTELSELVFAGMVETDGFTSVVISLQGEIRSDVYSSGVIGVLLIPDVKPVLRTLRDAKRLQFPLECSFEAKSGGPVNFEAEQVRQRIAFDRYQLYFYNTSNRSVEANAYLYLSN